MHLCKTIFYNLNLNPRQSESFVCYVIEPWRGPLLNVDVLSRSCRLAHDRLNLMTDHMPMVISRLEPMYITVDPLAGQSPSPPLPLPLTTLRQTARLALQLKRYCKWTKGTLMSTFFFFHWHTCSVRYFGHLGNKHTILVFSVVYIIYITINHFNIAI